jgi:hypothetical protein
MVAVTKVLKTCKGRQVLRVIAITETRNNRLKDTKAQHDLPSLSLGISCLADIGLVENPILRQSKLAHR